MIKVFEAYEPLPGIPIERKFLIGANFKIVDEEQQIIEGYASTRDLDRDNEIIDPEAFRETMPQFMNNPVVMYGHETGGWQPLGKPIGKVIEWEINLKGLWVRIQISKATQQAREIWMLIQENILRAFSIGFRPIKWQDDDETKIRTHLKLELYEISVVPIPANPEALMRQAKAKNLKLEIFNQKEDLQMLKPGDPGYVEAPTSLTLKTITGEPTVKDWEDLKTQMNQLINHYKELDKKVREETGNPLAMSTEHKEAMAKIMAAGEKIIQNQEEMGKRFPKRDIVFADGRKVYGEGQLTYEDLVETPTKHLSGTQKADLEEFQRKHDQIVFANHLLSHKYGRRFVPVWELVKDPGFVSSREKDGRKSLARLVREWKLLGNQFTNGELDNVLAKVLATATAGQGAEFVPTMFSAQLIDRIRVATSLAGMLMNFNAPSDPWKVPVSGADLYGSSATQATAAPSAFDTTVNAAKTANITFTHSKMRVRDFVSLEEIEDSIIPIIEFVLNKFSMGAAMTLERALINGQKTGTHQDYDVTQESDYAVGAGFRIGITNCVLWNGLRWLCRNPAAGVDADVDAGGTGAFTLADIITARTLMGKKGVKSSDLIFLVGLPLYYLMLTQAGVQGMDVFGLNATIVRGEIESVYGMKVVPSGEFPTNLAATGVNTLAGPNTTTGGIIINKNAFAVSYRRGFELESERVLASDQLEVVGFMRVAFENWFQDSAGKFNEVGNVPASYLFNVIA